MVRVFVLVSVFTSVLVAQPADASSALRADAVLAGREAAAVIESVDQGSGDVNCVLGPWLPDPEGVCNPSTLKQPFIRSIVVAPQGNGKACGTPLAQDMPCKPVHCQVGPWSDWLGCVDGRKSRTRDIVVQPNAVGRACPNRVDTVKCRKQDCQVCKWSDWVCDLNSGDQTRTRRVIKPKELDGADCPSLSETKPCELCAPPTNGLHFANEYSFKVWNDVTQPECCAKCGITAGCKAYTFRPTSTTSEKGDCYAKSDTTTQVSGLSNRYVSATVSSPKSCPEPPIGWTEGKPVFCDSDSVTVYRYACGEVLGYPDPTIAASWDPLWRRVTSAQCTSLQKGPPLGFKPCPPQPEGVPEGFPVKCDTTDAIYRSTCGEVRLYRDPDTARSWDIAWAQPRTIDCTDIPRGVDMPKRECSPSPLGIAEGAPIKCSANSNPHLVEDRRRVYRYECNEIRWYPNEPIAYSWDATWLQNFVEYDCSSMQVGPDMPMKA